MKKNRLLKYLMFSDHNLNFNKFRLMDIGIIENDKNDKIINTLINEGKIEKTVIELLEDLNFYLRKNYRGKFKFGLVFDETTKNIDEIILDDRKRNNVRKKFNETISQFNKIKKISETR